MEISQALHRCISDVLSRPAACTHVLRIARRASPRFQRWPKTTSLSTRTFVASAHRSQDSPSSTDSPSQEAKSESERFVPTSPIQQVSKRAGERSSSRGSFSRDEHRIDLSTIPGIGSNYTPPKRDPRAAKAKLDSLLQQQSSTPRPSSQIPQSLADRYNTFAKPQSGLSDGFSASTAGSINLLKMIDPSGPLKSLSDSANSAPLALRLRPTLGRTQAVRPESGFDLTRAFRSLEVKCNANNVKRDEISQRFHVRRGQKKKIDRSRRWRVLFKEGFLEECSRVRRMMRQGW